MKESEIQRACLDYLAARKIFAYRSQSIGLWDSKKGVYRTSGVRGVPDITAILKGGVYCGIEVKSAKGKLSEAQEEFSERIVEAGAYYLVVHSVDELECDLKEIEKELSKKR